MYIVHVGPWSSPLHNPQEIRDPDPGAQATTHHALELEQHTTRSGRWTRAAWQTAAGRGRAGEAAVAPGVRGGGA